jgi:hypothetical protein
MVKSKTKLYKVWQSMKGRCYCKTHTSYDKYGANGVYVCNRWMEYEAFSEWAILSGWEEGLTIGRIDSKQNYSPDNCRIESYHQQNMTLNRMYEKPHGYTNVYKQKSNGKYVGRYGFRVRKADGTRYSSGSTFDTSLDAAIAYNRYCDDNNLSNRRNNV